MIYVQVEALEILTPYHGQVRVVVPALVLWREDRRVSHLFLLRFAQLLQLSQLSSSLSSLCAVSAHVHDPIQWIILASVAAILHLAACVLFVILAALKLLLDVSILRLLHHVLHSDVLLALLLGSAAFYGHGARRRSQIESRDRRYIGPLARRQNHFLN